MLDGNILEIEMCMRNRRNTEKRKRGNEETRNRGIAEGNRGVISLSFFFVWKSFQMGCAYPSILAKLLRSMIDKLIALKLFWMRSNLEIIVKLSNLSKVGNAPPKGFVRYYYMTLVGSVIVMEVLKCVSSNSLKQNVFN